MIGPMKSNLISSFGILSAGNWFFRTRYVRFNVLTGHFAWDTSVAFLLNILRDLWPSDFSCRHRHFVYSEMALVCLSSPLGDV